ncbi:Anoctamin-10, partial [Nibea albiflora]
MSKASGDEGGDGGSSETAQQPEDKAPVVSKPSGATVGPGWTKVSCPCCVLERVEPLVLVKLGGKVRPETKRWLIRLIGASQKDGGAALLAHPGEDASGDIIVVSAPRCTLLRATEELGLCKTYSNGNMEAFSYNDRDNFKDSGQKLGSAGVIVDTFPLHDPDKLKDLSEAWYSGNQLAQPLDSVNGYFGSSVAFYFSFLDFYTWSLLPPAILGLTIAYFSGEVQKDMEESVSGSRVEAVESDSGPAVSGHMIQAVFSMIWSTVVMEMWKRRSASLSYRWGTLHLAERFAEPRPGFHG